MQAEERERGNELGGFHFLVLLEDCVAGGDCFFCLCAHRLAPRLLLRAFDSVLEARGLRCGARAAFCGAVDTRFASQMEAICQLGGYSKDPFDFSEVFLVGTCQDVFPGHFESYTTKERRLGYRRQNLIGSRNASATSLRDERYIRRGSGRIDGVGPRDKYIGSCTTRSPARKRT